MPKFDWKYLTMFAITLASVAVPVWLWNYDLAAKAIQFRIISQTSLTPNSAEHLSGLTVTLNAVPVQDPYITVVRLENTGSKVIVPSDFATSPDLTLPTPAKIFTAKVTDAEPKELVASVQVEPQRVAIDPLLLNPGDALTLTILTSGGRPSFGARGRIAGVKSVGISGQKPSSRAGTLVVLCAFGSLLLLFCAALVLNLEASPSLEVHLRGRAAFTVFNALFTAGAFLTFPVLEHFGMMGWWQTIAIVLFAFLAVIGPARAWNRVP